MKKLIFGILSVMAAILSPAAQLDSLNNDKQNHIMATTNKTLVIYYSYTAGNTKGIAMKVAKTLGADTASLEPVIPYSADYDKVVKQGQDEVESHYLPELKPLNVDLKDYNRIIIGSPTWWYAPAPVVMSFLEGNDLSGKTVVPFITNAGWPGHAIEDMTKAAQKGGAEVEKAHAFRFSASMSERDKMITSEKELNAWISSLQAE